MAKKAKATKTKAAEAEVTTKKRKKKAEEAPVKATKKAKKTKQKEVATGPKPIKERLNKTQLVEHLAEKTELDKKEVKKVMEALEETMIAHIRKKGAGEFMFPGLFKVVTKRIPAKKGGEKKISFGKEIITKPKPATTKLKIRPMKKLKDAALS